MCYLRENKYPQRERVIVLVDDADGTEVPFEHSLQALTESLRPMSAFLFFTLIIGQEIHLKLNKFTHKCSFLL